MIYSLKFNLAKFGHKIYNVLYTFILVVGRAGVGKLVLVDFGDGVLLVITEVITEEPSVVKFKPSVVGFELSGVGFELSCVGFELPGVGFELSGVGFELPGVGFELSDVGFEVIAVVVVLIAVVSVEDKADVCVLVDLTVVEADIAVGTEDVDDVDNIVDIKDVEDAAELRVVDKDSVPLGLFVLR